MKVPLALFSHQNGLFNKLYFHLQVVIKIPGYKVQASSPPKLSLP